MKNKFILYLIIFFFIISCSGFGTKRSEKSDEFLIEKKNPLVMPPDIMNYQNQTGNRKIK